MVYHANARYIVWQDQGTQDDNRASWSSCEDFVLVPFLLESPLLLITKSHKHTHTHTHKLRWSEAEDGLRPVHALES